MILEVFLSPNDSMTEPAGRGTPLPQLAEFRKPMINYLVCQGIKPFQLLTFRAPDLTSPFGRRRQGFGTARQSPVPTNNHRGSCWVRLEHTQPSRQQAMHKQQPCNNSTNNIPPSAMHSSGGHEPEMVSLHSINLDHFTRSLNSISKADDGAVLPATPRITL